MSKSRNGVWGDPYEWEGTNTQSQVEIIVPGNDDPEAVKYLEEAHEALSRLYNKTHKRSKVSRAPRKGELWH